MISDFKYLLELSVLVVSVTAVVVVELVSAWLVIFRGAGVGILALITQGTAVVFRGAGIGCVDL